MIDVCGFVQPRWRGMLLIAATYFYFLIFAQFGFLHRVEEALSLECWNLVLGAMGLAGLCGALWAAFVFKAADGNRWLRFGFVGAGLGAVLAVIGTNLAVFVLSALISGFSLAVLTVVLVGVLETQFPARQVGVLCGLGTGFAYFLSNVPVVFVASPWLQCVLSIAACGGGFLLSFGGVSAVPQPVDRVPERRGEILRLCGLVAVFLVLIWSDSAAFTRIQETPELKAVSWTGSGHLWWIGSVHLLAAVVGGWLMDSGRARLLYVIAFCGLMAGLALLERQSAGLAAALLYAAAVSLYSTALVAFSLVRRGAFSPVLSAGVVFGISGWIGSGLGIGMANDLGYVPRLFWLVAAVVLLLGFRMGAGRRCA